MSTSLRAPGGMETTWEDSDQGGRSAAHAAEFLLRPAGLSRRIPERQALDVVGWSSARGVRILYGRSDEPDLGDSCLCEHLQGIGAASQLSRQTRSLCRALPSYGCRSP